MQIGPVEWAGLRLHSVDGRDIALPVGAEYQALPLPRPLSEYRAGSVPADSTPPVWPDPLFSAGQAMMLWPPREPAEATRAETPTAMAAVDPRMVGEWRHAAPLGRPSRLPRSTTANPHLMDAFDVRLGWIPFADALEIVGTDAWEAVKKAIRREALRGRCRADGITRDLKPHWLDFLAFDHPNEDVLWFDREKVWRARTRDASLEPVPDRASEIVLSLAQCRELWPDRAWPEAGHPIDEFAGGTDPLGHTHTIFEWCMIYTDRHPAAVNPNYNGATLRDREFRSTLLGTTGGGRRDAYGQPMGPPNDPEEQIRNEIYRELVRDIERDRIIPVKTAYCSDAPDMFDPTRCLLDIEPMLAIARRRGDFGVAMAELLAKHSSKESGEKTRSAPPSREKPFWPDVHVAAFEWLVENGCPAPGDGNQASLERFVAVWLENHWNEASESAIRRHVARCIKERRAELNT